MRRDTPVYFRFIVFLSVLTVAGIAVASSGVFCSSVQAFCEPTAAVSVPESIHTLAPRYVEYSPTALQQAKSNGKVLLYFWAPWCATCSTLDTDIQKNPDIIPVDVTVLRIDYDHATELKAKYNVVTQHTFVWIGADENALATWVGGDPSSLREHIR